MSNHDPRPANWRELAQKFRKIIPPDLTEQAPLFEPAEPRQALSAGLEPYTGPWTKTQVAHLLKRTMFGVTNEDLNHFSGMTLQQTINELISSSPQPPIPVNDYNGYEAGFSDPDVPSGQTWINSRWRDESEGFKVYSMKGWNLKNLTNQSRNIHSKMYIFWMNHFAIQSWDVYFGKALWPYYRTLWSYTLGNFKDLTKAITLDPAMLMYLNGAANTKEAPDENYARELQELFTIGKGVNANFTEQDVQSAAKVLTGWTVNWDGYNENGTPFNSYFGPWAHDTSNKTFSSFYGNRVIQGQSGDDGANELDDLLDMIFDQNEVAAFLCRKLYRFFVYNIIDADTELNVIQPMAQILRDEDYQIKPVLEALFQSAHFFDVANFGALIKTPFDQTIGFWRMMGADYNGTDLLTVFSNNLGLLWNMGSLGQEMNDPPSVSGWPAFYQIPSFDKMWITTETISNRSIATDSFIWWGYWNPSGQNIQVDVLKFTEELDSPEDPSELIVEVTRLGLGIDITDAARAFLKGILLSGQANESYWTEAWSDYINDPTDPDKKGIVENRLKVFYQNMFHLAESQMM